VINLLPIKTKKDISYARKNNILIHWIIIIWVLLVAIILIVGVGIFYINQRANNLNRLVDISQQRIKDQKLEEFQKKAEVFSNDLNTAVSLLKNQLLFSKVIKTIGSVLPPGVSLSTLNYSANEETISLNIQSNDRKLITTAFENISNSQKITGNFFTKADLVKIECNSATNECIGSIVVLLNKSSDYYFLNAYTKNSEAQ
jgi:Tfp pilus assembly protein PilN